VYIWFFAVSRPDRSAASRLSLQEFPRFLSFKPYVAVRLLILCSRFDMAMGMPYGLQAMLKEGHKHFSGVEEAVMKNIEACKALAQMTKTSLGPNGMYVWFSGDPERCCGIEHQAGQGLAAWLQTQ
jgi:hypothetical protein